MMIKKQVIGAGIIAVVFIALIAISATSYLKYAEISAKCAELSEKKDCTDHEKAISNLNSEITNLREKAETAKNNTEEKVIADAEFFLATYYTNDNITISETLNNISPLVSAEMLNKLTPDLDELGGTLPSENDVEYHSGIESCSSYYRGNGDEAEVFSDFKIWVKVGQSPNRVVSQMLFKAKMNYDTAQKRWIVNDILQLDTVNIVN